MAAERPIYPIVYFYKHPDIGIFHAYICREPGTYEEYLDGEAFSYSSKLFDIPKDAVYHNQPSSQSVTEFFVFENVADEKIVSLLSRMNPPMDKAVVKSRAEGASDV